MMGRIEPVCKPPDEIRGRDLVTPLRLTGALARIAGSGSVLAKAIRDRREANAYATVSLHESARLIDVASMHRQFVRREVKRQEEAGVRDAIAARAQKIIQNTQSSVARYVSTRQARRALRRDSTALREREHPVGGHRERTYAMLANYETMIRDSPSEPTIREQWDSRLYFKKL
jgi:hypothetical protein